MAITGVYRAALDQQTVAAAAQNGTSTGFLWAHVPVLTTTRKARVRRIWVDSQHSTALATPTAPRLRAVRFTFTGTASGAAVTAANVNTIHPAPSLSLRTAVTGLTPTLVAAVGTAGLAGALTAVGAYSPVAIEVLDSLCGADTWPVLAAGEGLVIYQDTAGTTSDTRKFNLKMVWDEVDLS